MDLHASASNHSFTSPEVPQHMMRVKAREFFFIIFFPHTNSFPGLPWNESIRAINGFFISLFTGCRRPLTAATTFSREFLCLLTTPVMRASTVWNLTQSSLTGSRRPQTAAMTFSREFLCPLTTPTMTVWNLTQSFLTGSRHP